MYSYSVTSGCDTHKRLYSYSVTRGCDTHRRLCTRIVSLVAVSCHNSMPVCQQQNHHKHVAVPCFPMFGNVFYDVMQVILLNNK